MSAHRHRIHCVDSKYIPCDGLYGDSGATGPTGPAGIVGPTGAPGPTGPHPWELREELANGMQLQNLKPNTSAPYTENGTTVDTTQNFVVGSDTIDSTGVTIQSPIPAVYSPVRMYFLASSSGSKAGSVRAGRTSGNEWDLINVGDVSTAFGAGSVASGNYSTIIGGQNNVAAGDHSTILGGQNNVAIGAGSTVVGEQATTSASSVNSFVYSDGSAQTGSLLPRSFVIGTTTGIQLGGVDNTQTPYPAVLQNDGIPPNPPVIQATLTNVPIDVITGPNTGWLRMRMNWDNTGSLGQANEGTIIYVPFWRGPAWY